MRRLLVPGLGRRVGVAVAVVAILTQIGIIAAVAWGVANAPRVRDWLVVGKVAQTERVDGYVAATGMSSAGRFYLLAAHPTVMTAAGFEKVCSTREAGIAALGCYVEKTDTVNLLDLSDTTFNTLEPVVAAHEMLHAVWARFDSAERASVSAAIEATFDSVALPDLLARLAPYQSMTPVQRDPELFAILGTEVGAVTPDLAVVYERYFTKRMTCVELAASSRNVIATLVGSIESVGRRVVTAEHVITKKLKAYKVTKKTLVHDITVFNAHANDKGYYSSSSRFKTDRAALAKRQSKLDESCKAINGLIDEYNGLVDQLHALNAQAMQLNQSLGIDASAMANVGG